MLGFGFRVYVKRAANLGVDGVLSTASAGFVEFERRVQEQLMCQLLVGHPVRQRAVTAFP